MKIVVPKETYPGEKRVPLIPATVADLTKRGAEVVVEIGMGIGSDYQDEDYISAGAKIQNNREE